MVAILAEEFNDIYGAPRPHDSDLAKLAPGSGRRQDGKTTRVIFVRNEAGDGSRAVADHDGLTRPDPGEIRAQMCLEFRHLRILHDHKMTTNDLVVNRLYELGLRGERGLGGGFGLVLGSSDPRHFYTRTAAAPARTENPTARAAVASSLSCVANSKSGVWVRVSRAVAR